MKLRTKFTLIFILVFGGGLAVSAYLSFQFLERNARDQVVQQARLMMESAASMRHYTTAEIKPILETLVVHKTHFYPQSVPAYAATQSFNALRNGGYPEYMYKEAVLNPTNLRDRAVDWEADVINTFRNFPARKELIGERSTPGGRSLFLAHPIKAVEPCLECHSNAAAAPASMVKVYGRDNGFGWKPDEIVGAQIVSVPMSLAISIARQAFGSLMIYLGGVIFVTVLVLDLALVFAVVRPVTRLSRAADEISQGNMDVPELPERGRDEIARLARSFNRMYTSLAKAMRLLEEPQ
jgi:HAMP domain-containing protein